MVDPADEDVVPAVLKGVVGASVVVHTPVAGPGGGNASGAGGQAVAVEEVEVGGDQVRSVLQSEIAGQFGGKLVPEGQFAREVGLSAWDGWEQVIPDKKLEAGHS